MKQPAFDIDLVHAFLLVAETRSFTSAAQRLHCTQSAVSLKIKKLEGQAGCRLFDRDTLSVRLTGTGEAFLAPARHLLEVNEVAYLTLHKAFAQARVTIATAEDCAAGVLPSAVARLHERYPDVEVEVRCASNADMLDALDTGEVDFVIAPRSPKRVDGSVLRRERLLWVSAPGGTAHAITPVPLAVYPQGCLYRQSALEALTDSRRAWRIVHTCNHLGAVMACVASGHAVTAMVEAAVPSSMRVLGLEDGFPNLPGIDIMLYRNIDISPAAKCMASAIQEHFAGVRHVG